MLRLGFLLLVTFLDNPALVVYSYPSLCVGFLNLVQQNWGIYDNTGPYQEPC